MSGSLNQYVYLKNSYIDLKLKQTNTGLVTIAQPKTRNIHPQQQYKLFNEQKQFYKKITKIGLKIKLTYFAK